MLEVVLFHNFLGTQGINTYLEEKKKERRKEGKKKAGEKRKKNRGFKKKLDFTLDSSKIIPYQGRIL